MKEKPITKKKRASWVLPPDEPEKHDGPNKQHSRTGEPFWIPLVKWPNDSYLRGSQTVECCGCGLQHVETYEIFVGENTGAWWLIDRCYRVPGTGPKTKE